VTKNHAKPVKYQIDPGKGVGDQEGPAPSICELHRRLWRLVDKKIQPVDPETAQKLKEGLATGYDMGKRMWVRLEAYASAKAKRE
jgi:hypothetical protein